MSEQSNKTTKEKKEPAKKANVNRMAVVLDGGKSEGKAVTSSTRKKPSVSTSRASVNIPGELKESDEKKSAPTKQASKPEKKAKGQASKPKTVGKKSDPAPKKPAVKPKTQTQKKQSARKAPTPRAKAPVKKRAKVVPPKIGSRKGYRPSLAFRLRAPVFLIAFVVCVLALFFTFHQEVGPVGRYVASALAVPHVELTIVPGMSAKAVSLLLKEEGVVDDDQAILQYFISNNLATTLRSGTFIMEKGMEYEAVARILSAKASEIVLEVSPSFTLASIDRYLANRGYAKKNEFLKAAEVLADEYSLSFAEGWLLSGTYVVSKDNTASSLAEAMFSSMLEAVQPHLGSEQVSLWGLEQVLIIASMIQAETQNVEEMPLIASVIYNRLEAGEPLGIDATTRYEIDDWKNPIPKKALETKTPYNTRRKVGLPPSGICSPSKAAVEAALFPLESPYFYYLHGLDKRLYPAKTYEEHKENIKAYR